MKNCKEHPKYKGLRKPKCLCERCWTIYLLNKARLSVEASNSPCPNCLTKHSMIAEAWKTQVTCKCLVCGNTRKSRSNWIKEIK